MTGEIDQERMRVARDYDGYAASSDKRRNWNADNPGNMAIRAEFVQAATNLVGAELQSARQILDLGCGSGWWLARLASDPAIRAGLCGLDVLPERIAAAQARVPDASFLVGDVRKLPFEDSRFDVLTMLTVLSSLRGPADARSALREARRVLTPGGVLLAWEPRFPNPLNRSTFLIRPALIRAAFDREQMSVRTVTLLPQLARRLGSRTGQLYPVLVRAPMLRSHRLVCARKAGLHDVDVTPIRLR